MKTIIIALSLLILTIAVMTPAMARHPHGVRATDQLIEYLQLDEEQASQLEQILQEQRDKRKVFFETLRLSLQAIREETIDRLRPVLSEEQLDAFIERLETRRSHHRHRHHRKYHDQKEQ